MDELNSDELDIKKPIEIHVRPEYRYNSETHTFESKIEKDFKPNGDMPKGIQIVYKSPLLEHTDPKKLTPSERDLIQYMQIIMPEGYEAADYLEVVRAWPCIEFAWVMADITPANTSVTNK